MHHDTFAHLLEQVEQLTPRQFAELDTVATRARNEVEAVLEIDGAAERKTEFPHCGETRLQRWGRTRTGLQRRRCTSCLRTSCGLTGTVLQGIYQPGLLLRMVRDIASDQPSSCRRLGAQLDISRHTVWRWRMRILPTLLGAEKKSSSGIVEADEAFQRESRKGSREWVRHHADPTTYPAPPRLQWHLYSAKRGLPLPRAQKWRRPLLTLADRGGHTSVQHIADRKEPTMRAAMVPLIRGDSVLCTDGGIQYEGIARVAGLEHFVLVKGRRGARTPKSHHINTVNNAHKLLREFIRARFRGPATKYLDLYLRWFQLNRQKNVGYAEVFRGALYA